MAQDIFGGAGFDIQSILPKLQSKSPEELKAIGMKMDADGVPVPQGMFPDTSPMNVPGLVNAPQVPQQTQEMSGLQGAIAPTFQGLQEQNGTTASGGEATPPAAPSTWEQLLADPATMLQMSAALLAPRRGVSDLGNAVSGLAGGVSRLAQKKKEREASEAAKKEAESKQALRGAQGEQITAQTSALEDDREIDRDFKLAKTELARAQADAAGKKGGAAAAKTIQKEAMIKALFKTRPDKYASLDEARVAWETFEQTKGRDPLLEAAMTNIFLADKATRNTLMKGIFDSIDTQTLGEPAPGPTASRIPPVDTIPASKWLSLEGVNASERAKAEEVYGKDVVARKIAEAKGAQ